MKNSLQIPQLIRAFLRVKIHDFYSRSDITSSELRLLESYNQLRTDYVLQENWPIHSGGIDYDEYDAHTKSCYVVAADGSHVVAGMRLTRVDSLEDSLSYGMWNSAVDRKTFDSQIKGNWSLISGLKYAQVWDVTRLVTEASVLALSNKKSKITSRIGLFKVMARGVSVVDECDNPVWIFTTTEKLARFLFRMNFEVTILAEGKISETDTSNSLLCLVKPKDVLEEVHRKNRILSLIAKQSTRKK